MTGVHVGELQSSRIIFGVEQRCIAVRRGSLTYSRFTCSIKSTRSCLTAAWARTSPRDLPSKARHRYLCRRRHRWRFRVYLRAVRENRNSPRLFLAPAGTVHNRQTRHRGKMLRKEVRLHFLCNLQLSIQPFSLCHLTSDGSRQACDLLRQSRLRVTSRQGHRECAR